MLGTELLEGVQICRLLEGLRNRVIDRPAEKPYFWCAHGVSRLGEILVSLSWSLAFQNQINAFKSPDVSCPACGLGARSMSLALVRSSLDPRSRFPLGRTPQGLTKPSWVCAANSSASWAASAVTVQRLVRRLWRGSSYTDCAGLVRCLAGRFAGRLSGDGAGFHDNHCTPSRTLIKMSCERCQHARFSIA